MPSEAVAMMMNANEKGMFRDRGTPLIDPAGYRVAVNDITSKSRSAVSNAIEALKRFDEEGCAFSARELATYYHNQGQHELAIGYYKKLFERWKPQDSSVMAELNDARVGSGRSYIKLDQPKFAHASFTVAYQHGSREGAFELAQFYLKGHECAKDDVKAAELLLFAIDNHAKIPVAYYETAERQLRDAIEEILQIHEASQNYCGRKRDTIALGDMSQNAFDVLAKFYLKHCQSKQVLDHLKEVLSQVNLQYFLYKLISFPGELSIDLQDYVSNNVLGPLGQILLQRPSNGLMSSKLDKKLKQLDVELFQLFSLRLDAEKFAVMLMNEFGLLTQSPPFSQMAEVVVDTVKRDDALLPHGQRFVERSVQRFKVESDGSVKLELRKGLELCQQHLTSLIDGFPAEENQGVNLGDIDFEQQVQACNEKLRLAFAVSDLNDARAPYIAAREKEMTQLQARIDFLSRHKSSSPKPKKPKPSRWAHPGFSIFKMTPKQEKEMVGRSIAKIKSKQLNYDNLSGEVRSLTESRFNKHLTKAERKLLVSVDGLLFRSRDRHNPNRLKDLPKKKVSEFFKSAPELVVHKSKSVVTEKKRAFSWFS